MDTVTTKERNHLKCGRCKKKWKHCQNYISHKCNPISYECDICGKILKLFPKLAKHIKHHLYSDHSLLPKRPFTCNECNGNFRTHRDVAIHILKQHHNIEYKCDNCHAGFISEDSQEKHKCVYERACKLCGETFKKRHHLNKHLVKQHPGSMLACTYCRAAFRKKLTLSAHLSRFDCSLEARKAWLQTTANTCRLCKKSFDSSNSLLTHFQTHNGEPYECKWCSEGPYKTFEDLKQHLIANIYHALHKCSHCSHSCLSKEGSRSHVLSKHIGVTCPNCNRSFQSEKILLRHKNSQKCRFVQKGTRQMVWSSKCIVKNIRHGPTDYDPPFSEVQPDVDVDIFSSPVIDDDTSKKGWFDKYYERKEESFSEEVRLVEPNSFTEVIDSDAADSEASDSTNGSHQEIEVDIKFNQKRCRLCEIDFTFEYELIQHFIKIHPGKLPHQCPHCNKRLPLFAQLKEHLKKHGIGLDFFHCGFCSKSFNSCAQFERHSSRCQIGTAWPGVKNCRRCGKQFQTRCGYKRHRCNKQLGGQEAFSQKQPSKRKQDLSVTSDPVVLPDDASDLLAENSVTNAVVDAVVSDKPPDIKTILEEPRIKRRKSFIAKFECRICKATFGFERGLVRHFKQNHPGFKPLVCPYAGCNLELAEKLKEHMKTHGIGEQFICKLCGKTFNQKFLSKIHELWHEGIEYKCEHCKQKFLNSEKMAVHVKTGKCKFRDSVASIPCETCGRSFKSRYSLKLHTQTHSSNRAEHSFYCEFCNKSFLFKNCLLRHLRVHTGERPFSCRFCPKTFAQKGNCSSHERVHRGETTRRKKRSDIKGVEDAPQQPGSGLVYLICTVNDSEILQVQPSQEIV